MGDTLLEVARKMAEGPAYRSGREAELDWFPDVPDGINVSNTGYVRYWDAMWMVVKNQPPGWDPADPQTRMANDFQALVAEEMGEDYFGNLMLYTARDSALDRFHGVDGFFLYPVDDASAIANGRDVFRNGGRSYMTATIDLSLAGYKSDGYKADVILNPQDAFSIEAAVRDIAGRFRPTKSTDAVA